MADEPVYTSHDLSMAQTLGALTNAVQNLDSKVDTSTRRLEDRIDKMAASVVTESSIGPLKMLGYGLAGLLLTIMISFIAYSALHRSAPVPAPAPVPIPLVTP